MDTILIILILLLVIGIYDLFRRVNIQSKKQAEEFNLLREELKKLIEKNEND